MADDRDLLYALTDEHVTRIEYDGAGNPVYIGKASPGSATNESVWQIRQIEYDGAGNPVAIMFAGGSDGFAHAWKDREGYSYR